MHVMVAQCAKVISFSIFVTNVQCLKSVFQGIGTGSTSNIHFEQLEVPVPFTSYTYIALHV